MVSHLENNELVERANGKMKMLLAGDGVVKGKSWLDDLELAINQLYSTINK